MALIRRKISYLQYTSDPATIHTLYSRKKMSRKLLLLHTSSFVSSWCLRVRSRTRSTLLTESRRRLETTSNDCSITLERCSCFTTFLCSQCSCWLSSFICRIGPTTISWYDLISYFCLVFPVIFWTCFLLECKKMLTLIAKQCPNFGWYNTQLCVMLYVGVQIS